MLEELEQKLLDARSALAGEGGRQPPAHWSPPAGLGPLPGHLAPRAAALAATLVDAATGTAAFRDDLGRQLAAVRSVPLADDAGSSVYLDVTG